VSEEKEALIERVKRIKELQEAMKKTAVEIAEEKEKKGTTREG